MTCIKTGAVVLVECYGYVFNADLYQVENAIVVRANGPLITGSNALFLRDYERLFSQVKLTHRLTGDKAGNEFWRPELGLFVIPLRRLIDLSTVPA